MLSSLTYRVPDDLVVTPAAVRRVAVIGQCLTEAWPEVAKTLPEPVACDFYLFNRGVELPDDVPELAEYDFALIQIPLRSLMPGEEYLRVDFRDPEPQRELLERCKQRLGARLDSALKWNKRRGLTTFVFNFLVPQQNLFGRLMPRYDVRNPAYFIEELNRHLAGLLENYRDVHLFDFDQISATFGRRFVQDDAVWMLNHGGGLSEGDFDLDAGRLDGAMRASETFEMRTFDICRSAWIELLAMLRTLRQIDAVKLIVVDLDDTLWRGIAAEGDGSSPADAATVGWPMGLAEALVFLKRRGVLLAIVSKNDEAGTRAFFDSTFRGRLRLDDFAVVRINWKPKSENVAEILRIVNVLPQSIVCIDDNPVERAALAAAFPAARILGPDYLNWRRILLWSAETQVARVSDESANRTELVRAQAVRESERETLSHEDFLSSLNVELCGFDVGPEHPKFERAFELLNKTNQFNTTGRRWAPDEFGRAIGSGMRLRAFSARDRFSDYGLIALGLIAGNEIVQFVMSCRVVGLEIERAAIADIVALIGSTGASEAVGRFAATPSNFVCRDTFARCGFSGAADLWTTSTTEAAKMPGHVSFVAGAVPG